MRIHFLQHVPFEDPAAILRWAQERGHTITGSKLFAGERPPTHGDYDLLLVMGGPMSVHDEHQHDWLAFEKRQVREALDAGKKVLGICLGAQLLAEALGGAVEPMGHKEIGWFDVQRTDASDACPVFRGLPRAFVAFHWHGEQVTLPDGCRHLATNGACGVQAFSDDDRAFGLQFHLESTPASVKKLIDHCGDEIAAGGPCVQSADAMLGQGAATHRFGELARPLTTIMDAIQAV